MILLLLDGRAKIGNYDEAEILSVVGTEDEARRQAHMWWGGFDAIWYDCNAKAIRWDLPPAQGGEEQAKYSWQRLIMAAFRAPAHELPAKTREAKVAIAQQLADQELGAAERAAMLNGLEALQMLIEECFKVFRYE